jgi:hypothetical protein
VPLGPTPFDTVMILLPIWLPALVIGLGLQWLVIRGAVLSALRRHASDQHRPRDPE